MDPYQCRHNRIADLPLSNPISDTEAKASYTRRNDFTFTEVFLSSLFQNEQPFS